MGATTLGKLRFQMFEYNTNGNWGVVDSIGRRATTLFDTDTAAGVRLEVTITGADKYFLKMTPLDLPASAYVQSGTLENPVMGAIDWVEFTFFNTATDTGTPPTSATDVYIRSLRIVGRGDMDFDGDVDFDDIDDFVLGLNNPDLYESIFGVPPSVKGDTTDGDGDQDFDDIPGFVALLAGAQATAVPEPSALAIAAGAAGILAFPVWRRRRRG
jgi:hypothetical protein